MARRLAKQMGVARSGALGVLDNARAPTTAHPNPYMLLVQTALPGSGQGPTPCPLVIPLSSFQFQGAFH